MANILTTAQLQDARIMIDNGNLKGFYDYMASNGYGYANLAKGVVDCTTLSGGTTAQNFMAQAAAAKGISLSGDLIRKTEIDMAYVYVRRQ